jgi:hypothetical protein
MLVAAKNITDGTSCDLPTPQTMFLDRPQGLNSAALFNPFYYECCDEHNITWYWFAGYRYRSTWDSEYLAPCMFQSSKLVFAGSHAGNLDESELVADFIGMAPGTRTTLTLKPKIQDHIFDFFTRFDLCNISDWFGNGWLALGTSLAYSNWNLHAHAITKTTNDQFNKFPACYMGSEEAPGADSLESALSGTHRFGNMQTPLQYGKWRFNGQSKTRLANLDLFLGDDIIARPKFHIGAFLKTSAPTGNRPDPEWIFSPVVGNGHHWEFGGGLDTHWTFYDYDDECFQLYIIGSLTHLFNDTQWRSFDFKTYPGNRDCYSGAFSRYVLLRGLDENNQYNGELMNAINFTTRKIQSSFNIQGDAIFRIQWRNTNWAVGLGYNVFGRSAETISGPYEKASIVEGKRFGIKGTTGTCAHEVFAGDIIGDVPLNATESKTRMFNFPVDGESVEEERYVDNYQWMSSDEVGVSFNTWDNQLAQKSVPPIPVTDNDILFQGIPALITHKIFLNLDYQWETCCHCWQPYLGIGAEVEFGQRLGCSRLCSPNEECYACEPRFWSIWIQGGMNF